MRPKTNPSLPIVIDSTIRASFVSCPTKFFYSFLRNLGGKDASIDLVAGGSFAKGLEVTRKLYYGPQRLPIGRALEQGMVAAIAEYGDVVVPEFKTQKGPDRVVEALAAYFDHFEPTEDKIQPYFSNDEPAVEFTVSVPLPITHPETGQPFIYGGRFDMLGLYAGQLVVVDEKTTSQLGPTWVNKWNLRGQFTGYVWACHTYDLPVIGAIVRGVRFTKTAFSSESFAESIQMRAAWQLEAWYEQLLADVERMVSAWKTGWYDQALDEACAEYGGCPFQRLCTAAEPENWIEGHYGLRHWDPLKKNPYEPLVPEKAPEVIQAPEELLKLMAGGR